MWIIIFGIDCKMQDFVICSMNVSCTSNFDLFYVVKMSDVIIWDFVMNVTKYLSLRGEQTEFARLKIPSVNRALIAPFELYETARRDRERERERKTATVLWLNRRFQMYCCFSPSLSSRYRYIFQLLLICCFYYYYFFVPIRHKFYEASHFQRAYLACVNSNKCKE